MKDRARQTWAAGNYDKAFGLIGLHTLGEDLVDHAEIEASLRVLDVGAGSGNAAIAAARKGAEVVASDLTPELFEPGRKRAADAGVEVEWVEADAEDLPFEDESFDRVLSAIGAMFAPRHEVTAAELARVCRPGGIVAMANWTPAGLVGRFFATMGKHLPPPPDFASPPPLWGDEDYVRGLFEPQGLEVDFDSGFADFRYESIDGYTEMMEENFGPMVMARRALGEEGWAAVRADLDPLFESENLAEDGSMHTRGEYLVVVARKP